ncbi:MAG: DUF2586 family protein [Microscillaceae bacterium]|nr:DUF2586 family protein [Microscillaceae bacterium]
MSIKGVEISKAKPDVFAQLGQDSTSGLIANGVAVAGKLALDTVYTLYSLDDAIALGVDESYDAAHSVILYHHIKEFYEEVGLDSGVKLYLLVVAQSVTMTQMVDVANNHAKKLIDGIEDGDAFQIGVAYNPVLTGGTPYTPTMSNGLDADLLAAIPKAQALAEYAFGKMMPTRFVLEGKFIDLDPIGSLEDLRSISDVEASAVSVVIGQDWDFADSLAAFNKYAAVGTVLGTVARAAVNESIGWVEVFNLTNVASARWVVAGLSDHTKTKDNQSIWNTLDEKGYIFPLTYSRVSGYRWNKDHTCTPILVDPDGTLNESFIRYSRTADKAALQIYAALIGSVQSPQRLRPDGKLELAVIADLQARAEKQVDTAMAGEISGREIVVDKDSDLLPPDPELLVGFKVQPYGSADTIKIKLKLTKSII